MTLSSHDLLATIWLWVEEHLSFFDPRSRSSSQQIAHLKAFDELCLLGVLKARTGSHLYLNDRIVDHCLAIMRPVPVPLVFLDNIAHFQLMAMPAGMQALSGEGDSLKRLLQLCVPNIPVLSTERLPHRLLDVIYCSRILKIENAVFGSEFGIAKVQLAAIECSNLRLSITPHLNTLDDFYALTHTIFFATNFGEMSIFSAFRGIDAEQLSKVIELAILRFLCEENLDIVAELIWCLLLMKACRGPIAALAIITIAGCVKTFGYLRGPETKSEPPVAQEYSQVWKNYHSTLLASALFSNYAIETFDIEAETDSVSELSSLPLSSFYEVGKLLNGISEAHPLHRYELIQSLTSHIHQHPYLAGRDFHRLLAQEDPRTPLR